MMKRRRERGRCGALLLAAVTVLAGAAPSGADDSEESASSPGRALKQGTYSIDLRYRFEAASVDGFSRDAQASTLRTALGYRSALFHGFGLGVEFENVTDLGLGDRHDNGASGSVWNGVDDRPVIPDPEITEVNQATLRYARLPETRIEVGRQKIELGPLRYVGTVAWRQNYQSFDAVRLTQKSIPRTTLVYAYLANANRILGDNASMDTHLLDAAIGIGESGTLTAYIYRIDYEDVRFLGLSTTSYGARWTNVVDSAGAWSLPYHVEYARQKDVGDNPDRVDVDYLRLELAGKRESLQLTGGWEVLGAKRDAGRFTTPLATLHKFNGWADRFVLTPDDGLRDLYLAVGGTRGRFGGKIIWHDFRADVGGAQWGTELDAELRYSSAWNQVFALKFADYRADEFATDSQRFWFWTSYAF